MLKFDINILWTLINLVILFVLMKLFLFKPIKKVIDKRQALIDDQFKRAQDKEDSANKLYEEYETQLSTVAQEKKEILSASRNDAKAEYDRIVDKAQSDADKIIADARKSADIELKRARESAKEEIAALAMETAAKIIGGNSSSELDKKYYDEFLNESSDD